MHGFNCQISFYSCVLSALGVADCSLRVSLRRILKGNEATESGSSPFTEGLFSLEGRVAAQPQGTGGQGAWRHLSFTFPSSRSQDLSHLHAETITNAPSRWSCFRSSRSTLPTGQRNLLKAPVLPRPFFHSSTSYPP